ncbi:MAG: Hpt domain-containing protein [Desulfocapsa sp.]|nr:MAG: Hpt domain-containing protein [Desulfocapsa sp.]
MSELRWNKAFALEQAADDEELLQELIEIFKESSASDLANLKQSVEKDDTAMARAHSHSIKGAAASLGMDAIREITELIENDCREGSLTVAIEVLPQLEKLLALLQDL